MTNETGTQMTMPVVPAYGNGGGNGGWGGDWSAWIIIFVLFFAFGGWGNGFGGFGGGGNGALTRADLCSEFNFNGLENSVRAVQNGLCDGFYAMNTSILQSFNGVQQGQNATNIAIMQAQNALQAQAADCCCQTQRAIDGVNYNMATNTCNITNTMNGNTRDIIDNQNSNTRAILDYLCQDKISNLQNENQALRLAASQQAQNVAIGAMIQASEATILRRTGAECPTAAYIVQPPTPVSFPVNAYGQAVYGNGCGCNGNGWN